MESRNNKLSDRDEIKRKFSGDSELLEEFKIRAKEEGKSYKRVIQEAIQLWLEKQKERS